MGSQKFMKMQVGLQTAHGTAATPTIQIPVTGTYTDKLVKRVAPYDSGTWTPTTIVNNVAYLSEVKATGDGFFEMMPVWLNSAFEDVAPSVTYTHTYTVAPAAIAVPMPLTALLGAVGENLGVTGPAVKIKDLYVQELVLSGNMNTYEVNCDVTLFGGQVDDNAGAGYAFASVALPVTMDAMKTLLGGLNIDDAGTTGGAFATMTAFAGALLDWKLSIKPGIGPKWSGDSNSLASCGIVHTTPVITFTPTVRTTSVNYALVKAKEEANTYQELELTVNGTTASDSFKAQLTGRWTACPTAHERKNDELVMTPTFTAETSHLQTTTPHYAKFINSSTNNWT